MTHGKHWHGAAADIWLAHIAITPDADRGAPDWLGPVKDEVYANLS